MVFSPSKKPTSKPTPKRELASNRSPFGALKLQKGPKPLNGKKFFFDLRNYGTASKLETSIKSYGGVVIPFIGKDIDIVVTDRPEWGGNVSSGAGGSPLFAGGTPRPSPSQLPPLFSPAASPAGNSRGSNFSPSTLDSPVESNGGGRRQPRSRAEAMLEKVRLQPQFRTRDPLVDAQNWGLNIWSVDLVLKLIHKIALSHKKGTSDNQVLSTKRKSETIFNKIKSRSGKFFIKIESVNRQFRPSYKDLPCWPTINLNSEPGSSPFVLKPENSAAFKTQSKLEVVKKKDQLAFKSSTVTTEVKGDKPPPRRSPRKRDCTSSKVSPSKRNVAVGQSCTKTNTVGSERKSLIPPRPPSKRHPERALFPEVKKDISTAYEPLAGYCEICKVDYQDLRRHCQTEAHKAYSTNAENYVSLDKCITTQALNVDTFFKSVYGLNTRNSEFDIHSSSLALEESNNAGDVMRQPVDDRHISSKMVGRKETLEVQCNGIANHVQTRFACTKGDRENLGGIFLDDRLSAAQLRKRRSISVSCKDLLEIAPGSERTHYLRSGRSARSELSQLSPALSDNSHPLLNSNSQQPLLSPTLSERGHHLRTRSQLWSNLLDEESVLVTANNHSDKNKSEKSVEKCEKGEKLERQEKSEKSAPQEDSNHLNVDMKDKGPRELRLPRNHSRNRSIRRKRLSAEEKLIEDNRGYYKVEVLNSKLRSTGYYVNHQPNQGDDVPNGASTTNGPGHSGSQGEKEPVVVRFKKVRRSELSVLSDEAENFMFGEQTKSESNSDITSESDEDDDDDDEVEDEDEDEFDNDDEDGGGDGYAHEENGMDSRSSRSSQRNGRRSSSTRHQSRSHRLKIRVGNESTYSRCPAADNHLNNGFRKNRRRRTQAEAFITDNMDYYKFEMAGSRLRVHGSPSSTCETDDAANQDKTKLPCVFEQAEKEVIDGAPCPISDLHFSFESVPSSEVWFQTFQRQDRGEELFFPSLGEPSLVVLPYQVPRGDCVGGHRLMGKRRSRHSVRLPRKSPRCHASTLAILSSVVRRRSSKDPEKAIATEDTVPDDSAVQESKHGSVKQPMPSTSTSEPQVVPFVGEDSNGGEEKLQEMVRSIDSLLGLASGSSSDIDKDHDVNLSKPHGKGRGRKKQSVKPTSSTSVVAPETVVTDIDREKDPSLNYLVDPAVLEELACTCDVVSNPRGGPTMDIVSLLDSYSDCCCIVDDYASTELGVDASCNSSECGASSTCDTDRRRRKKRKRPNMTGWDKPKRKCILRRDVGSVSEDVDCLKNGASKDDVGELSIIANSTDSESNLQKVPNSISSPSTFKRKLGSKRKLRSSLTLSDSSRKGNGPGQARVHLVKLEKDGDGSVTVKKGKSKKVRRLGWSKAR